MFERKLADGDSRLWTVDLTGRIQKEAPYPCPAPIRPGRRCCTSGRTDSRGWPGGTEQACVSLELGRRRTLWLMGPTGVCEPAPACSGRRRNEPKPQGARSSGCRRPCRSDAGGLRFASAAAAVAADRAAIGREPPAGALREQRRSARAAGADPRLERRTSSSMSASWSTSTSTGPTSAPTREPMLDGQAEWLSRYPEVRVRIEGNCDERGTREYNFALGARRAGGGARLSSSPTESRRPDHHHLLRQGAADRSRPRRGGLAEEPQRPHRHHRRAR